jgi:hypothetical protein
MILEPPFETAASRPPQGEVFFVMPRMPFSALRLLAVVLVD